MNNIYIFTEGCLGKSQDQFWRLVNRYVYKDSLRIVACDGIGNVAYKIGELAVFNNYIDNTDIIIIDIDDVEENKANIDLFLNNFKNKVIIIDNADILIDINLSNKIYRDRSNQYILMGRRVDRYNAGRDVAIIRENNQKFIRSLQVLKR